VSLNDSTAISFVPPDDSKKILERELKAAHRAGLNDLEIVDRDLGYSARIVLNRRTYGVNWSHPKVPNFVGDNVEIEITLITKAIDFQ